MQRFKILPVILLMSIATAQADSFSPGIESARQLINPIGDRAFAGSDDAFEELLIFMERCEPESACPVSSTERYQAAVAAANLSWYYQQKNDQTGELSFDQVWYSADGAALGSPHGYYFVGTCLMMPCVTEDEASEALAALYTPAQLENIYYSGDASRLPEAAKLLKKSSELGYTQASVDLALLEGVRLEKLVATDGQKPGNTAIYAGIKMDEIIKAARTALSQSPTDDQAALAREIIAALSAERKRLNSSISVDPGLAESKAYLKGLRERLANGLQAPAVAPARPASQTSQAYLKEIERVRSCKADAAAIEREADAIEAEYRALDRREKELNQNRITIEGYMRPANPNDPNDGVRRAQEATMWQIWRNDMASFERDEDAYNERLSYAQARERKFNNRWTGDFRLDAVSEVCGAVNWKGPFCRNFDRPN